MRPHLTLCLGTLAIVGAAIVGCWNATTQPVTPVSFEIRLAQNDPAEGLEEMAAPQAENSIYVSKDVALSNADVAKARAITNEVGLPAIELHFAKASQEKVAEFSSSNIGKVAAIFINGKLESAPIIIAEFSETAEISGDFTREEAQRIAKGITAEEPVR